MTHLEFCCQPKKYFKYVDNSIFASNSISEETKRSLKPVGIRPGATCGLYKVHKDIIVIACLFDLFCQQLN